jgi:hypothetical protein
VRLNSELDKVGKVARFVWNYLLSPSKLYMPYYLELIVLYIRGDGGVEMFLVELCGLLMRGYSSVVTFGSLWAV